MHAGSGPNWAYSCGGWSVLGPGNDLNQQGDGYVLDCGEMVNGVYHSTQYWVSSISNPSGQTGRWELQINGATVSNDLNNDPNAGFHTFVETNGGNVRLDLVWHPNPPHPLPKPPKPVYQYGCNNVNIQNPHVKDYRFYATFSGTTIDSAPQIGSSPDIYGYASGVQNIDGKDYDILNVNYYPTRKVVHIESHTQHWNGSKWVDTGSVTNFDYNCYHASCNPAVTGQPITVAGDGPGGIVQAGHPFTVYIPIKNDNTAGAASSIPPSVTTNTGANYYFSLSEIPDDYDGSFRPHLTNFGLDVGETQTMQIDFPANGNTSYVRDLTLRFYPDMYGSEGLGDECDVNVRIYQHFDSTVAASSTPLPTLEHPYKGVDYTTWVVVYNESHHDVVIPTYSSFYKQPAAGGHQTIAESYQPPPVYHSALHGYGNVTLSGHYDPPPGTYQAGDEYCAHIQANYTSGWVGPDNLAVYTSGPAADTRCPRVRNEPYFKVYHSDISAGGAFDKCTFDGGTLAGYADISDPAGATRGSTTQLSALALLKITGVASAKSPAEIAGSPTKLTFANKNVQIDASGNESPVLGGQFGGCRTLTNEAPPPSASQYIGSNFALSGKNGAYKTSGNLTVTGGKLLKNNNASMFVNGDAYISGDITYGNNWKAGTAPSFVLHATGNIYIAPGVRQLAGVFIAQNKIYTCADKVNHFKPMSVDKIYTDCNKQLEVDGSFVAKQINLMRTFGSLRDEVPDMQGAIPDKPGALGPLVYMFMGKLPGLNGCVNLKALGGSERAAWQDNYLCPATNDNNVKLGWTNNGNIGGLQSSGLKYCTSSWGNVLASAGYPRASLWSSSFLCSTVPISFSKIAGGWPAGTLCTQIVEPSSPGWPPTRVCVSKIIPGTPGTPIPRQTPLDCSNKKGGAQLLSTTCAGEVFYFSPALYLSNPAVNPPGGGQLQFQAITSLPPVL